MKIKVFFENIKRAWKLSSIWSMPSDYYSQSDTITNFIIKTDKGNILYVEQGTYGIVWDSCNDRIFAIKNDKGEELVRRSIYPSRNKQ